VRAACEESSPIGRPDGQGVNYIRVERAKRYADSFSLPRYFPISISVLSSFCVSAGVGSYEVAMRRRSS
jgi:hypothetical protein